MYARIDAVRSARLLRRPASRKSADSAGASGCPGAPRMSAGRERGHVIATQPTAARPRRARARAPRSSACSRSSIGVTGNAADRIPLPRDLRAARSAARPGRPVSAAVLLSIERFTVVRRGRARTARAVRSERWARSSIVFAVGRSRHGGSSFASSSSIPGRKKCTGSMNRPGAPVSMTTRASKPATGGHVEIAWLGREPPGRTTVPVGGDDSLRAGWRVEDARDLGRLSRSAEVRGCRRSHTECGTLKAGICLHVSKVGRDHAD